MFQALGSWGRGKKGEREKKRGRTKARICSRPSVVGDGEKRESERKNEGGLRRGYVPGSR